MNKQKKAYLVIALAVLLVLTGCTPEAASTQPSQAAVQSEARVQSEPTVTEDPVVQETTPEILEGSLFLKVSSVTLSLVGETDDIYLGVVPRELVAWESEDPSIVSVENGVLTATGVGTTTIHATYYDRQVSCSAGCLARTQEELESLGPDILNQPKRIIPEVDMEAPCTYFENAAIVGDSINYMLLQCESKGDYLGNMLFLTRGGVSLNGFVRRFKNLYYQGREMNLEDVIAESQVDRMYILIGSNDIAEPSQRTVFFENWDIMLERIREKSPDVEIVLISNIPRSEGKEYNDLIEEYNTKMRQYAKENGCMYLDLYYYIQDHCKQIPKSYNLDGYHLNDTGYMNYMKVLRYYAQYELEGGTLS